ncbi:hypothetical protein PInf_018377 [Phytophthora infestans]|nr:hypothetical protein PInf_018377 [Phytophthora infestans]
MRKAGCTEAKETETVQTEPVISTSMTKKGGVLADLSLEENPDMVDCDQGIKRRRRSCKLCVSIILDRRSTIDIIVDDDGNINTDPNNNKGYHVLNSGSESEGDDLSQMDRSDSDSSASDSADEEDEELYDQEERFFADKFLSTLGGQERFVLVKSSAPR